MGPYTREHTLEFIRRFMPVKWGEPNGYDQPSSYTIQNLGNTLDMLTFMITTEQYDAFVRAYLISNAPACCQNNIFALLDKDLSQMPLYAHCDCKKCAVDRQHLGGPFAICERDWCSKLAAWRLSISL